MRANRQHGVERRRRFWSCGIRARGPSWDELPEQTPHGTALPFDVFNFDRRPGEVYRRR